MKNGPPEFNLRGPRRPEDKLVDELTAFLKIRDWYVKKMHGNAYQKGFPDLYIGHRKYGHRLVECKILGQYAFTENQLIEFPKMSGFGIGIWILVAATEEEYQKLWQPPNWYQYLPVNKAPRTRTVKKKSTYTPKYPTPGLRDDLHKKR